MRKQALRIAVLQRLARSGAWVPAREIYESFDAGGGGVLHNRIAQTVRRAHLAGFIERDLSRYPRLYRITDAGRAELAVLVDPVAMMRRKQEWGAKRCARRYGETAVAA